MLMNLAQVARRLGVCESTARKMVASFPFVMAGKRKCYLSEVVEEILEAGRPQNRMIALGRNQRVQAGRAAIDRMVGSC